MPLSTPRSSRYRKSLSSLLSWSRYNSIPPIIFPGDDDQFERERRRELQLTLDKLEGRVVVNTEGKLQLAESEDGALGNVCGLMSMLGGKIIDTSEIESGDGCGRLCSPLNSEAVEDWHGPSPGEEGYCCGSPGFDESSDIDSISPIIIGDLTAVVSMNITHPAFSWLSGDETWETSSRISEDSLFDNHTRLPPKPQLDDDKAVTRFSSSSLGTTAKVPATATTTIPFFRDSLCSKILSESWPQTFLGHTCFEKTSSTDGWSATETEEPGQSNTPRTLSYAPQFTCGTNLAQAGVSVFQGKPSFMKRVIKAIVQPMKMLTSRNKKHQVNLLYKGSVKEKSSEECSENDGMASFSHSGIDRSAGKKVVFNDTIGYRLFRKNSLCTEDH